ncbi:hypothetical protein CL656_03380 [bacterium]|nr:hypothetical protein [bacterium]|tara:strand:- start:5702 stop:6058 length:357 start_codon:yes stop_codon:yes gene_type:complete
MKYILNNLITFKKTVNFKEIALCKIMTYNNICTINHLFVDKKYRNLNYGSELLKIVENHCIHNNIELINVTVHEDSLSNTRFFYFKNGYLINYKIDSKIHLTNCDDEYTLINMYKKLI